MYTWNKPNVCVCVFMHEVAGGSVRFYCSEPQGGKPQFIELLLRPWVEFHLQLTPQNLRIHAHTHSHPCTHTAAVIYSSCLCGMPSQHDSSVCHSLSLTKWSTLGLTPCRARAHTHTHTPISGDDIIVEGWGAVVAVRRFWWWNLTLPLLCPISSHFSSLPPQLCLLKPYRVGKSIYQLAESLL